MLFKFLLSLALEENEEMIQEENEETDCDLFRNTKLLYVKKRYAVNASKCPNICNTSY